MEIIITIILAVAISISSVSFYIIARASRRPANGELGSLARLDRKILHNQQWLIKHL